MKLKVKNNGYILVLTLMILSVLVVIVTSMFFNQTGHSALTKTIVDREKAKMLALAGVQLAVSKLTIIPKKSDEQKKSKEANDGAKNDIKLLMNILPTINRWQTINLVEDIDGIAGQIKFSISSENGKINLNQLYDFSKHKFVGEGQSALPQPVGQAQKKQGNQQAQLDAKKFIQDISAKIREFAQKDVFKGLMQFLQNRKIPLNDVTELLEIPEFSYFNDHVFFEPIAGSDTKRPIFLTDIFTTWTDTSKLQPWVLSDSVSELFGLKRASVDDDQRSKSIEQWIKKFKPTAQWKNDWDNILKPMYGKDFKSLNKQAEYLFESQFGPNQFSVVSYGTVGNITQKIFAIVEIETSGNTGVSVVKVRKLYWI